MPAFADASVTYAWRPLTAMPVTFAWLVASTTTHLPFLQPDGHASPQPPHLLSSCGRSTDSAGVPHAVRPPSHGLASVGASGPGPSVFASDPVSPALRSGAPSSGGVVSAAASPRVCTICGSSFPRIALHAAMPNPSPNATASKPRPIGQGYDANTTYATGIATPTATKNAPRPMSPFFPGSMKIPEHA